MPLSVDGAPQKIFHQLRRIIRGEVNLPPQELAHRFLDAEPLGENQVDELAALLIAYRPDAVRELLRQYRVEVARRDPLPDVASDAEKKSLVVPAGVITKAVEEVTGVSFVEMRSDARTRDLVTARQLAMYFIRQLTPLSLVRIGDLFDRDHSTVINSIRQAQRRRQANTFFRGQMSEVRQCLESVISASS